MKIHDIISQINTMIRAFGSEALISDVMAHGGYKGAIESLRDSNSIMPSTVLPRNRWEIKIRQDRLAELNKAIREHSLSGILPNREWVMEAEQLREYLESKVG